MGGALFEKHGARRHTTNEIKQAKAEIFSDPDFLGLKMLATKDLGDKETHGDLDILVVDDGDAKIQLQDIILKKGWLLEIYGNICSTLIGELQVDFMFVDEKSAEFAREYYSYNDLGTIIGFYAKCLGLKLGEHGLYVETKIEQYGFARSYIEYDFYAMLELLGISSDRYKKGFANFEEAMALLRHSHLTPSFSDANADIRRRFRVRPNQGRFYEMHTNGYFGVPTKTEDFSHLATPLTPSDVVEFNLRIKEAGTHHAVMFTGVVAAARSNRSVRPNITLGKNHDGSYFVSYGAGYHSINSISEIVSIIKRYR